MRFLTFGLFLPLALGAQQTNTITAGPAAGAPAESQAPETKPEDRCSIEGRVLSASTEEPIKKADLILRRADRSPGAAGQPLSYSTSTDVGGSFSMKDIEPGNYRLSVNRTGFVSMEYGARGPMRQGTTLSLASGQRLRDVVFHLTPHGVVTGRVFDEDGEPMARVQVLTMRYRYMQGRKQLLPFGSASTNDLGEYRIFGLAPGRYYLCATDRSMMYGPTVDRSANPQSEQDYVPIDYPGTTDVAGATTLDVSAGAQLRGVDVALSKERTIHIKGRVENLSGSSRNPVQLMLFPRAGAILGPNRPNMTDAKGNFEIRGVAPGPYTLIASIYDGERSVSARQPVEAAGGHIDNLVITIRPPLTLQGDVQAEGQTTADLSNLRIELRPKDSSTTMMGPMINGRVKDDGTFTLPNAGSDLYSVTVSGLPDGFYVRSIRSGDDDVLLEGLDLSKGAAGAVHIVLSPGAGQLAGSVQNDKQQPAAGATITAIPQEKQRRELTSYYKTVTTDQYGRFTLKNLDPGEYKVFAWEDIESGAYFDPDFVKTVESQGESVTIRENSHDQRQLKLIPAGAEKEKAASN
jgi:protocatechuate 3,4-dioxygenase beta subunit